MVTKRELQDGAFIVQEVSENKLSKEIMSPLNYVNLSGLSNSNRVKLKKLSDLVDIKKQTISPDGSNKYEVIDLSDFDKSLGEISKIKTLLGNEILSRKTKFNNGDILFGKLRPYLNQVMIVNEKPKINNCFIGSSEWITFTSKNKEMTYYIFLVLRTKFTLFQTSASHGSVRPRFNPRKKEIKIPMVKKEYIPFINNLVDDIFQLRKKYKIKLDNLIKKYDNLADIKKDSKTLIEKVPLKNINSKRMDHNYYILNDIWEEIKKKKHNKLCKIINFSKSKTSDKYKPNDIIKYITISDVDPNQGEIINWEEKTFNPTNNVANKAPNRAKMLLNKNNILLPYLKLSLNSIAWVPPELDGSIGTNGFAVIEPINKNNYGFIYVALRSKTVQSQLSLLAAGTIMEDITPEELNRILIYEPPMEIKNEIIDKSAQYLKILWKCRKSYNEITSFFEEYCSGFINEKQFKNELKNIKNEINSIPLID